MEEISLEEANVLQKTLRAHMIGEYENFTEVFGQWGARINPMFGNAIMLLKQHWRRKE